MWWFKRHPELLIRECQGLESDSNYIESTRARSNLLVSSGEIIVRLNKNFRHPILIVYPDTFPYELPRVFLLKEVFSKKDCEDLSKLDFGVEFFKSIQSQVKFQYKRHQNPDGSLCLLENDNLDDEGAWFFTIHQVLKRVRDWLVGVHTGHFPPEGPELELFVHFPNQDPTVEILATQSFYTHEFEQGDFYGALFNQSKLGKFTRKIYCGISVCGKKNGLFLPSEELEFDISLLIPEIETAQDIIDPDKEQFVKKEINKEKIIRGYWWKAEREFHPFSQVLELAKILGDGDENRGYSRMYEIGFEAVKTAENKIYFGIQFPNRRDEQEWVFLSLTKKKDSKHVALIGKFSLEEFKSKLNEYDLASIYSEKFTDDSYHRRNEGLANRNSLKEQGVNIVGCGSLGSEIADTLCKAGLRDLHIIDDDLMKINNPVRHLCGIEFTGYPKVVALKSRLFMSNPFVTVSIAPRGNILSKNAIELLNENYVSVSSIADDNTESYLNEQCVINNRTVFFARALRGGKVARIFRVIPGRDACFNCLTLYKRDKDPSFIDIPEDPELPTITNECNNPIRPGSAAELKLIASLVSGILIDSLQNDFEDTNHWIWSKENIGELKAFQLKQTQLPPHKDCVYCRNEHPLEVRIKKEVLNFMVEETKKEPSIETGGVLLGAFRDSELEILFASGPGSKAIKRPDWFEKDIEFCQEFLDSHFKKYGSEALYIGEWHYHPFKDNRPSNTDLTSLSAISNQKEYLTDKPVMIILNSEGDPRTTVHPVNMRYYETKLIHK